MFNGVGWSVGQSGWLVRLVWLIGLVRSGGFGLVRLVGQLEFYIGFCSSASPISEV
jgi:hypothetical protein